MTISIFQVFSGHVRVIHRWFEHVWTYYPNYRFKAVSGWGFFVYQSILWRSPKNMFDHEDQPMAHLGSLHRDAQGLFFGGTLWHSFWEACSSTYFGSGCWFDTQAARSTASWALVIVLLVDQHGIGMRGTGGDLQLGTRRHRAGIQLGLPKTGVFSYLAMATLMGNMMISND